MDIHDMGARSEAGNKHLLVIVDRASKFLFAYTLPNNTAENTAKKLIELLLNYGIYIPVSTQRPRHGVHPGSCPTLLQIAQRDDRHGPTDHPRAQGAVERLGGWIYETLMKLWPPPSAYYSAETGVPRWMLPH